LSENSEERENQGEGRSVKDITLMIKLAPMMNPRRTREQLEKHILETERILELATDHPVMRNVLQKRLKKLRQQLENISPETKQLTRVNRIFPGFGKYLKARMTARITAVYTFAKRNMKRRLSPVACRR
jgi:DNA-binding transcriptional regulator/RsmH inhibitor MraZ